MSVLNNPKQEAFAQAFIKYKGIKKKWKAIMQEAGYTLSNGYFNQLKITPKIRGRILELQKEAASDKVLKLQERLELLTEFARNDKETTSNRIKAVQEIHRQSGDDVNKLDIALDAKTENVVRFIDVKLPQKEEKKVKNRRKTAEKEEIPSLEDILGD